MDFALPDELRALQAEATEVAMKAAAGRDFFEDSWIVGHDADFAKELGDRGWLGMTWPVEEGGHGRTALERFVVFEALIANGAPVAASWFADRQMGPTLLQFGTAEQRRRWLPGIVAGESMWCIGMSEPDAGSDVASLRTQAVRRRQLGRRRTEGLDERGRVLRLVLSRRPHRSRRRRNTRRCPS